MRCDLLNSGVRGGGQGAATSLNSHKESPDVHQDRFMAVVGFDQVMVTGCLLMEEVTDATRFPSQ